MSNPVSEVQITLKLDSSQASDRLALASLQRWYQRGKMLNSDNDAFDFFQLQMHKDIYLSGLFLSLLDPNLVKSLSQNLQLHRLDPEFLYKTLEEHQLTPGAGKPTANPLDSLAPDDLATRIADQLYPLLSGKDEVAGFNEPSGQLQTQANMLKQLQEQSRLLQQQANLLDILASAGAASLSESTASMHPATPVTQSSPAAQANQTTQSTQANQALGGGQLHDLSETAAKVRKVRAKGVF
jgi:hypothetical protein